MNWALIAQLVVQYGIPFVDKLIEKWTKNDAPTVDEWNSLKQLANQNARTQMLAALSRAGIDPNSPQGQALFAQVPG